MNTILKKCTVCKEGKSIEHFHSDKSKKDGLETRCKICNNSRSTVYAIKNADVIQRRYRKLIDGARSRELEVGITMKQHDELLGKRVCHYCDYNFSKDRGVGLNRVDSSKGYVLGNLKPCCGTCNKLMNNFTVDELKSRLIKIYKRLTKGDPIK